MLEYVGMEDQRRAILAEIEELGPVLAGCIIERSTRCQTEGCRCGRALPSRTARIPPGPIAKAAARSPSH